MPSRALLLALAFTAHVAHAQVDTGDAARDEARKLYTEGVAQMKRKDFSGAHQSFAKANTLYEASTIKLQYALCLEKEGKFDESKTVLRDLVAHPPIVTDSQPLKEAYAKGIAALARIEASHPVAVIPSAAAAAEPASAIATPATPKPEAPAQPRYDLSAKSVAVAPLPAAVVSSLASAPGATSAGTKVSAPAPVMTASEPKPESTPPSTKVHSAGILLGAHVGGATGDPRTDQEGVVGAHGGVYLLRNVYAGGRIGWYGSAGKNARSSGQQFEFGLRTEDNGAGISASGLLGARRVESWVNSSAGSSIRSSTQTEIGLVLGKRLVLGQAFYASPEVALLHSLEDRGTYNPSTGADNATTQAATRIYLGLAGEFHIGL